MGAIRFGASDGVAPIVLDNAGKHNAVDAPMRQGLEDAYADTNNVLAGLGYAPDEARLGAERAER
jgi:enoyl-CoA hydratase/carnithine racemase